MVLTVTTEASESVDSLHRPMIEAAVRTPDISGDECDALLRGVAVFWGLVDRERVRDCQDGGSIEVFAGRQVVEGGRSNLDVVRPLQVSAPQLSSTHTERNIVVSSRSDCVHQSRPIL